MKPLGILFLFAAVVLAREPSEKISVPLQDPSRPARIQVHLLAGAITVRGADIRDVEVEVDSDAHRHSRESHSNRAAPPEADGMKRLDLPGSSGLDIVEENNVVTIRTPPWKTPNDLVITVPRRCSLQLKSLNSRGIFVDRVDGEIDVDELNGQIALTNVSGSVVAHSLNGGVVVTLDRIDPSKPMSFSTLNGNIDVTLPDNVKANVRLKTDNGAIYSDFDVRLNPQFGMTEGEPGSQPDGMHRLHLDHTLRGTINGGGPEFQFTSFNGKIYLRKKK